METHFEAFKYGILRYYMDHLRYDVQCRECRKYSLSFVSAVDAATSFYFRPLLSISAHRKYPLDSAKTPFGLGYEPIRKVIVMKVISEWC